jgi:hypothetical protein
VPDSPLSIRSNGLVSNADLDATVRRTVLQLNSICKTTTLRFTLAVTAKDVRASLQRVDVSPTNVCASPSATSKAFGN